MEAKTKKKARLAIVVSEFNSDITYRMLDRAKEQAARLGATLLYVFYVPGSFEMPIAVEALLKKNEVQAVVTLGAVIKGETRHDDIVAENASRLLADLSLKYGKPVALGISGPGMTVEQAKERAESVPVRAVSAAVEMVDRLGKLEKTRNERGSSLVTIGLQTTHDTGGHHSH
ncbi:MAG: 6,7-dimethyl-8-ribityllumazine synthase [Nitrososphaera sp.]|jgi:6,7-dimethyl-8-ribityllumazine synthase